jgi:hypothetical protein
VRPAIVGSLRDITDRMEPRPGWSRRGRPGGRQTAFDAIVTVDDRTHREFNAAASRIFGYPRAGDRPTGQRDVIPSTALDHHAGLSAISQPKADSRRMTRSKACAPTAASFPSSCR